MNYLYVYLYGLKLCENDLDRVIANRENKNVLLIRIWKNVNVN